MKREEKNSAFVNIATIKKEILMIRIKMSSGDNSLAKDLKSKKKEVARLFTKINQNKA